MPVKTSITQTKSKGKRKSKKSQYRVRNWAEYNQALKRRADLTIWFSDDVVDKWRYDGPKKRGGQKTYSDLAIETGLTVRAVLKLALRQAEGFLESLVRKLGLTIQVPDYSTLSRRQQGLKVRIRSRQSSADPVHLVVDSSGVKVYGEGEWKVRQHGVSKRRTWRKIHFAFDEQSGEIMASELTTNDVDDAAEVEPLLNQIDETIEAFGGDGAYDKKKVYDTLKERAKEQGHPIKMIIPPRKDAKIWQHGNCKKPPHPRDENLRYIRKHGRKKWKQDENYHRRSLAETGVFRYKMIIGATLKSRLFENQEVEAKIGAKILNQMMQLGMPQSYKVA